MLSRLQKKKFSLTSISRETFTFEEAGNEISELFTGNHRAPEGIVTGRFEVFVGVIELREGMLESQNECWNVGVKVWIVQPKREWLKWLNRSWNIQKSIQGCNLSINIQTLKSFPVEAQKTFRCNPLGPRTILDKRTKIGRVKRANEVALIEKFCFFRLESF